MVAVSFVIVINKLCFSRAHYRRGKTEGHGQNATKPNTFASDDFEIAHDDVHTIIIHDSCVFVRDSPFPLLRNPTALVFVSVLSKIILRFPVLLSRHDAAR